MTLILETSGDKAPLEALRECCEKNPNSKLFMPLAEQLRRRGCYGEAIDICLRAKALHPRYISCRVLLGRCFVELGMREEARKELEDVLVQDRENVFSLRVMAELLRSQGDLEGAIDYYRALLRISPADMDAQQRLTEIAQLLDISEDNGAALPLLTAPTGKVKSECAFPEEEQQVESDSSSSSPSSISSPKTSRQRSSELLQRDIEHSDFSRFAEWISSKQQIG